MAQGGRRLSQRQRQRQEERQARRSRRHARRRALRWAAFAIVGVVAIALIVGLLLPSIVPTGGGVQRTPLTSAERAQGPGEHLSIQGNQHIEEGTTFPAYTSIPPTSGPHWPVPTAWGIYDEPVLNERQVHNLEHGGVIIQYNADDEGLVQQIEDLARDLTGFPACTIVAPYPTMEHTIAVTAWGVLLTLDEFDSAAIEEFAKFYRDQGPEQIRCQDVSRLQ